jgi:hypothetical protein
LDLDEGSRFTATGENNNGAANNGLRFFDYNVATRNALVGWQVGGDLWYNFLPGIKMGIELKTGIYNNRSQHLVFLRFASRCWITELPTSLNFLRSWSIV